MTRFRMSSLGAGINLGLVTAAVAFWYWRRKKKCAGRRERQSVPTAAHTGVLRLAGPAGGLGPRQALAVREHLCRGYWLFMRDPWQLVLTGWKRLLKLRMVAWSPPLVLALTLWWVLKALLKRRRARKTEVGSRQNPGVYLAG